MLKFSRRVLVWLVPLTVVATTNCRITKFSISDPIPSFKTTYPSDVHTWRQDHLRGESKRPKDRETAIIHVSPYEQKAKSCKNEQGKQVELGDVRGRWNLLAMLRGTAPTGKTLPTQLSTAKSNITEYGTAEYVKANQLGTLSVPLRFRKDGVRFEADVNIFDDLTIAVQSGIASIKQDIGSYKTGSTTVTTKYGFYDNTDDYFGDSPDASEEAINSKMKQYLTSEIDAIASQMGLNIGNFSRNSVEDFHATLLWQHEFDFNKGNPDYSRFLFIPHAALHGTIAIAKAIDYDQAFSISAGNNTHNSLGLSLGTTFDFHDTMAAGIECGYTHFFDKEFEKWWVPNDRLQSGLFPFHTKVKLNPGSNLHLCATLNSRYFSGKLSACAEFCLVTHKKDRITLAKSDSNFFPDELEEKSSWMYQAANLSLNSELSPNMNFGIMCQLPLTEKAAYKSSTIMATLSFSF